MENGSKALLISGAILLAISLISMATYLVSNMKNIATDTSTIGELDMQAYNSKYEALEGVKSGSVVKTILNYAIEDNRKMNGTERTSETEDICVNIRSNSEDILNAFKNNRVMYEALTTRNYGVRYAENIRQISKVISNSKKYKIWYTYTKTGYIWEIHIDKI